MCKCNQTYVCEFCLSRQSKEVIPDGGHPQRSPSLGSLEDKAENIEKEM